MPDALLLNSDLVWPLILAVAWVGGEFGHRWTGLPRISLYGLFGFVLANISPSVLQNSREGTLVLLANIAFGLILFEFGYRINLRWLRGNPWIGVSALVESIGTFVAVYVLVRWFGMSVTPSLLIASLAMSTSPAGVLRIVNEERSSGQVTERLLHLSAFNSVLAIFAFKVVVGYWTYQSSGSLWQAFWSSLVVLAVSAALGTLFGVTVPGLLRGRGGMGRDSTVAFAIAVILLVALTHTYKFSPVLATLTFGLVTRHRRVTFSQTQRNFGTLGELLTVLLFVFVTTTLEWHRLTSGLALAALLIATRFVTKTVGVAAFSRLSGITWRKGVLTGMALMPISVFAIRLLEQARSLGGDMLDQLAPLAAATLLLEIAGPILTQRALIWAKETPDRSEA